MQAVQIQKTETPTPAAVTPVFIPPTPEQLDEIRAFGQVPPSGLTFQDAKIWIEKCKFLYPAKAGFADGTMARQIEQCNILYEAKLLNERPEEVTIQEAAKPQNTNPGEYTIPAREVQDFAQRRPTIQKPATYKSAASVAYFGNWVDGLLARNQTCLGGYWFPTDPLNYNLDVNNIGLCRQLADAIESKGYCVEPDARFGGGKYDRNQTLALFKPLDDDPIQPSTAYLGAANLLWLCILITTADGKIDLVELEVFRRVIENQPGLSMTDHKRLLILEQLLAQELCSASKTAAKIAKSVHADKRLVIGKLLVEVAAANNVITDGERRVLEKIFKSFEIPPDVLERLIAQICPSQWPRPDSVYSDVSKRDKWLWNHWRTIEATLHGVSIWPTARTLSISMPISSVLEQSAVVVAAVECRSLRQIFTSKSVISHKNRQMPQFQWVKWILRWIKISVMHSISFGRLTI